MAKKGHFVLYKKYWKQSHEGQCSLMWDRVVSCGTDQSNVGLNSHAWDRGVLRGQDCSYVGQIIIVWDYCLK